MAYARQSILIVLVGVIYLPPVTLVGTEVKINCYRCKSRNFTDSSCHDTFSKPSATLVEACQVAMGSSRILVPANYCIKVVGTSEITGEEFIIRDCILDKPDDDCSPVQVDGDTIRRCTWTCSTDGCNGALKLHRLSFHLLLFLVLPVFFWRSDTM